MNEQQPGHDWAAAGRVLHSEDFDEYLMRRLVQIALDTSQSGAAVIRAVELLLTMGRSEQRDLLDDVPTDMLESVAKRLDAYIDQVRDDAGLE